MTRRPRQPLPLVLLLFFASGCAALIYEIVWFQLLELVIGSTAASLAVVLGTFMGGLCLGSLALPRLAPPRWHPLRLYAALEAGTGVLAIAVMLGVPALGELYAGAASPGSADLPLRATFAALCLLAPTLLIGATLPAIARWLDGSPRSIEWLGFFYGGNIAGGVFGGLFAGFYLLRVHDMHVATYVAASINGAIAVAALVMAARLPAPSEPDSTPSRAVEPVPRRSPDSRAAHAVIALSGLTALGAEVVWTRVLALRLGPTVYSFSIILAVVLIGLGIGSGVGSAVGKSSARPRAALGSCQLLLTATIAWAASPLSSLGAPAPSGASAGPGAGFARDIASCLWTVLPSTLLWGASFPLALAAAARDARDGARVVAGIYAANTLGAIIGAVGMSLIVIPLWGTQSAQRILIGISIVSGLVALAPLFRSTGSAEGTRGLSWLPSGVVAGIVLMVFVPPISPQLVAWGRYAKRPPGSPRIVYVGEGANSTVAVSERDDGVRAFHVAGKVEASTDPQDLRLERMLAHFPALVHPNPRTVLVVGFGAGITAGTFLMYPGIERIVIVEIEPLIPAHIGPFFKKENLDVQHDPRVEIVYDDARHYVLTSREHFDIITSDPIHPWVKGSATLYTREYFELAKRLLNPGGVISEWVPVYESREAAVTSEVATFLDVFTGGTLWGTRPGAGGGYDLIVLGENGSMRIDTDALQRRLVRPEYLPVVRSMVESGFGSMLDLFSTYVGDSASMAPALRDAQRNLDRNLRLQYLAGFPADPREHERTYADLVAKRDFSEQLFTGTSESMAKLRLALGRTR